MGGLTRFVLRRRWLFVAVWIAVVVVAALASSRLSDLVTNRFTLPGTDTRRTEVILEEHFGQSTDGTFTVVVQTEGTAEEAVPRVRAAAARGASVVKTGKLASVVALDADIVIATIVTKLDPAEAKGYADDIREAVGEIPGATVYVSGQPAIEHRPQPPLDLRGVRAARPRVQARRGRVDRPRVVRPDRGLDPGDDLRHALRPLHGLRGFPRVAHARGMGQRSNEEDAVALGLTKTGRLVTAAGLVMFAAFLGFVAGSVVGLQQFGFGLAAAILIDVTIVRALLVPSAMKLFGKWNWWLPGRVARVLRVEPSPLGHRRPTLQPTGQ